VSRLSPEELAALRAGEPQAVGDFYRRHARQVLGWCIRLGGPDLDHEDLAHSVFETALKRLPSYRGESSPSTWLYGITRRVLANRRRRAAFRRFLGMGQIPEPRSAISTDGEAARIRRRRAIQHALERLSEAHRELIVLCDLEGRTAPEVSAMLGIPAGTVYSRQHAARKRFREALEAEGITEAEGELVLLQVSG
jgi:RNA polymerase sigma-70 factor (ECF subfamily)